MPDGWQSTRAAALLVLWIKNLGWWSGRPHFITTGSHLISLSQQLGYFFLLDRILRWHWNILHNFGTPRKCLWTQSFENFLCVKLHKFEVHCADCVLMRRQIEDKIVTFCKIQTHITIYFILLFVILQVALTFFMKFNQIQMVTLFIKIGCERCLCTQH